MWCPDCRQDKSPEEFPRNRSTKTGRQSYCKPCYNARMRMYKEKQHGSQRNFLLKLRYGIDEEDFARLLAAQESCCAICGDPDPHHVDHDHATGRVRGVLCFNCNGALGRFFDDVETMRRAARYLRRHLHSEGSGATPVQLRFGLG